CEPWRRAIYCCHCRGEPYPERILFTRSERTEGGLTKMTILVAYASKHGSTQGIAEQLRQLGKEAEARPVEEVTDPGSYEAFVIGSAVYYGSWLKEATEWVHHHQAVLAGHPVWLFSVGPLGTEVQDAEQQPKEMTEF